MFVRNLFPQVMLEADKGGEGGGGATSTEVTNPETKVETKQDENMIPLSRFNEVNSKYKELAEKVQAFETAQAEAERLEQEKKGEFEKLYREKEGELSQYQKDLQAITERATALESRFEAMVNSKIEAIDENYRDLIPTNLSNEAKLEWIEKAESKGLFGKKEAEVTIGESTNHRQEIKRDVKQMSAMEKLLMGYGKR